MLFGLFSSGSRGFVSTWKTDNTGTSNDDQITLPLISGNHNFTVYWGDGNSDTITAYDDAAKTHTYASAGTYQVVISGTIEGWRFANGGDCEKITDISQWGNLIVGTDEGTYFMGCKNMTVSATDVLDVSGVTNMYLIFRDASVFNGNIFNWDVSSVTNMKQMFTYASVFDGDLSGWDVSSVTTMKGMFYRALVFNQNIGSWDVSNVTNMFSMFFHADGMSSANLGKVKDWTITDLTDATNFMSQCTNSMSTADYSELLIRWEDQTHEDDVSIHFNNATINSNFTLEGFDKTAGEARDALLADGWVITDGDGEHQLILDAVSGAVAGYSTRLLRADYSGYAVEVRNDSNEETDIGFTDTGELDEAALLAHADGGDAFVVTWYDQSGNGNDATQGTANNQPMIVAGGVVQDIEYDGSTDVLEITSISELENVDGINNPFSINLWAKAQDRQASNDGLIQIIGSDTDFEDAIIVSFDSDDDKLRVRYWGDGGNNISWDSNVMGNLVHIIVVVSSNEITIYEDDMVTEVASGSFTNPFNFSGDISLAEYIYNNQRFDGSILNTIIFNTALSEAERTQLHEAGE